MKERKGSKRRPRVARKKAGRKQPPKGPKVNRKALSVTGLTDADRELVVALRQAVRRAVPQAEESLVWGSISYHRPDIGGRVKGAICQIVVRNGQVRLDFIHGVHLRDPAGMLRGDRLSKRYVPIASRADAERPEVVALLLEAAALNPATINTHSQ